MISFKIPVGFVPPTVFNSRLSWQYQKEELFMTSYVNHIAK